MAGVYLYGIVEWVWREYIYKELLSGYGLSIFIRNC